MSLPSRDDIDEQYRFDLTHIFATPAEWDDAEATLRERLAALESRSAEELRSVDDLRGLLELTAECHRRKQRLELYAMLSANVDTESDAAATRQRRVRDLESAFEPTVAAVRRRLGETDDRRLDDLVDSLEGYRRYAESLRQQAAHVREPAVERVIADHGEVRSAPTRILRAIKTDDFDPPTVERPDGETVAVRPGNRRSELSHPDRDYRRRVYDAYWAEFDRFEGTYARSYAEKLSAAATDAAVRNYASVRDRDLRGTYPESGLEPAIPGTVHETLLEAIRSTLDPFHRAQRRRRDRLDVDSLRPWDLDVSIADPPAPEIPYEDARDHILAALAPLGEEYVDRARSFFEQRRIDVFPTQDKRTDIPAYCPSSAADGAFVLANYRGDVRTMFFLCHELGHALNVSFHREGATPYATCPTPVSEVPSILHELLLVDHCLEVGGPLAAHARNRFLECIGGNLFDGTMHSAFAHRLVTAIESGEALTAARIREAYATLLAEFRPIVDYGDRAGRNWLGTGLREPYSSYQYVLGATGALVVRDRLRDGTLDPGTYHAFLRNTGREPPIDLFDRLGAPVATPEPYERAATAFDEYLERV
ncbi:M3 family oligoendopeptidase [Halosolutus halophilus]|uniref:M3 family oligoendopeptidase n=1 Tax=Halosolutus halophilus TaxID=1552990 RepID=UPI0022352233|nr:M3 family metallopeptidase [Halosolutus halophilus]